MSPRNIRMPEIRSADPDTGTWLTVCSACRKRWESARGENRDWVAFVAAYHRHLHQQGRI